MTLDHRDAQKRKRLTRSREQHLDPFTAFLAQEIAKLDARKQAAHVFFELGADKVIAPDEPLSERSGRVRGVPGLVDRRDDLVHPFAVSGGERDERRQFRVQDLERCRVDLKGGPGVSVKGTGGACEGSGDTH